MAAASLNLVAQGIQQVRGCNGCRVIEVQIVTPTLHEPPVSCVCWPLREPNMRTFGDRFLIRRVVLSLKLGALVSFLSPAPETLPPNRLQDG